MNDHLVLADGSGGILAVIGIIIALIGLALNIWKTFANNAAKTAGAVVKTLATILGGTPTAPEVGAFIMLARETIGSPLIGGGVFASLIELASITFGFWILFGDPSIDGVPINKTWGLVFIGIGLMFMMSPKKRQAATQNATQRMITSTTKKQT